MNLRKWILGGLALSLFTIAFTFGKILLILPILVIVGLVTLLYSYAAIARFLQGQVKRHWS